MKLAGGYYAGNYNNSYNFGARRGYDRPVRTPVSDKSKDDETDGFTKDVKDFINKHPGYITSLAAILAIGYGSWYWYANIKDGPPPIDMNTRQQQGYSTRTSALEDKLQALNERNIRKLPEIKDEYYFTKIGSACEEELGINFLPEDISIKKLEMALKKDGIKYNDKTDESGHIILSVRRGNSVTEEFVFNKATEKLASYSIVDRKKNEAFKISLATNGRTIEKMEHINLETEESLGVWTIDKGKNDIRVLKRNAENENEKSER